MFGSTVPRKDISPPPRYTALRPRNLRACTLAVTALFAWTMVLAMPAAALAHPMPKPRLGVRTLSLTEMQHLIGRQFKIHATSVDGASGPAYPWEGSAGDCNTGNGNKLTSIPIVG